MSKQTRRIPAAVRRFIDFHSGSDCRRCGREIDGQKLIRHIDHILPRSLGGEDVVFNLQPLCHECNLKKGSKVTPRAQKLIDLKERRAREVRHHFQHAPVNIEGNGQLRQPQEEAYISVKDHFAGAYDLPALVVIPTGVGKSVVLALAPYGIAEGRVLVITPNLTIKDGLEEKLTDAVEGAYRKYGILPSSQRLPRVVVLESGRVNREDCLRADIVIANIQQVQGWLHLFPRDFFDMVAVDEAHHVPATSWQNVHDAFPNAKSVYVTATPFRSDGKAIVAEEVHTTTLAEAMTDGYIKNVVRSTARASEMTFVVEGEEREYDLDEIMEMREETWFSRGVALSETSNRTIAEQAIALLQDKRQSGVPHQIIAAACSVAHARKLEVLFEGYGLRATYVASRGMTYDEREQRIDDFDEGAYDVIVHVGILGEGYDNPNISIAAIFRPYRSTAPYAQFVGRAVRRIGGAEEDDNIAHAVDHVGLNLCEQWDYFKKEQEQAQILGDLDDVNDGAGDGESGGDAGERDEQTAEVTNEVIDGFDIDTFVEMAGIDSDAARDTLGDLDAAFEALRQHGLHVPDEEKVKSDIARLNQPSGTGDLPRPNNRPDKERQARRKKLISAVRKAAGRLVQSMEIDGSEDDLVAAVGHGEESGNYEVVIRALHRRLNGAMGKDGSNSRRNDWLIGEFKRAEERLPEVRKALAEHIEAQTDYRRGGLRSGNPPFSFS